MEKVGVVICNYNKAKDVIVCIRSVLESKNQDFHIYVVDNASSDDSVQRIRKEYGDNRKVTLICNNENLGGSGGFNTGLRIAEEQGYQITEDSLTAIATEQRTETVEKRKLSLKNRISKWLHPDREKTTEEKGE